MLSVLIYTIISTWFIGTSIIFIGKIKNNGQTFGRVQAKTRKRKAR